ncbi:MAG TPA: type II toxin-antitoxin system HicA family toxin [Dehalococcoidia bacterium]|nr:type II toxin-antitoxin system HicA family toxin [Dehalococcoidia bacterium]
MTPKLNRVSGRELVRILESLGWEVERIKGSHHIMRHTEHPRVRLSVPVHAKGTLPIGTQASILRDAGVSAEEFNEKT